MTYSIVYTSKTGNTALLAEQIRAALPENRCIYFGAPHHDAAKADVIFVGFWTNKGACSEEITSFLKNLTGKQIFLFGTAGFGGAETYFQQILERVGAHLKTGNTVAGTYMCQGKMPLQVRERYAAMEIESPAKACPMLENFDRALSHPDADDLKSLAKAITKFVETEPILRR